MKKKEIKNLSRDEINEKIKKLLEKEESCSLWAKLIFSASLSLSIIVALISQAIPLSYLLGVGIFSLGGLTSLGFVIKGSKCVDEIAKLEKQKDEQVEQLVMEDILKETYKPTPVKKTKTIKTIKENNNDLGL